MHILDPIQLRHLTLRNRITFGAHTTNMSEGGLPGKRHRAYYLERSLGGAAMIVIEPVPVHPSAVLTRGNFRHNDDSIITGFRKINEQCQDNGTVMIHQLYHVGQHGDYDLSFHANWSPSGLPSFHDGDGSHLMRAGEIEEVIECFVQAAVRAKACGFNGIEIFASYNSLVEQFWLPWSNRRDDEWGGSFSNRMRFSTQIASRIRAAVGDEFVIGMAVSIDNSVSIAMGSEVLQEVVNYHDQRSLIDYFTCGTGSYFDYTNIIPSYLEADKLGAPYAEAIKQVCKHALVQAESHIRTPENANSVISSKQADLVSIVRGQIADPHWVNKVVTGEEENIRGCISCNQMCWGRRHRDYWISCLINPSAGREFEWGGDRFSPADKKKKILVVGAGPAGLEAARVAAECGHQVSIAEAGAKLGGQFRLAGLQPRRSQILELIDWYERQFNRLGVEMLFNTPMFTEDIKTFNADEIVLATGSQPTGTGFQRGNPELLELPGVNHANVYSVEDVMNRSAQLGDHIVLIDDSGDWRGLGTALELTERGIKVTAVTTWSTFGKLVERTGADLSARKIIKRAGGKWHTESAVIEWNGSQAIVQSNLDLSVQKINADALVLATTNESDTWLLDDLNESHPELIIHTIGDVVAPRQAAAAIYDGRKLGMQLGTSIHHT